MENQKPSKSSTQKIPSNKKSSTKTPSNSKSATSKALESAQIGIEVVEALGVVKNPRARLILLLARDILSQRLLGKNESVPPI